MGRSLALSLPPHCRFVLTRFRRRQNSAVARLHPACALAFGFLALGPFSARATVPGANDVLMRTLEFRQVAPDSPTDAFQAIRHLHANRLEWTYLEFDDRNRDCVERVQAMGVVFGGAAGASMHGSIKNYPPQTPEMHMTDLNGAMIIQPHMRKWEDQRGIGDPSNTNYYAHHLGYWKKVIDWGADTIQRDEPESPVFAAERYGGGFTPSGIAGFRTWLATGTNFPSSEQAELGITNLATFDYGEWLRAKQAPVGDAFAGFSDPLKERWIRYWTDTNTDFWNRLLAEVRAYATNRPQITFACNNTSLQMWESYHRVFDYAISELLIETAHPVHFWERTQIARAAGKLQVFGAPKTRGLTEIGDQDKALLLRRVFSTSYANGMLAKVPWDVFDQSPDGKSRYYVAAADLADLTAFVRGAGNWAGYAEAAAAGAGLPESAASGLRATGGNGGVYSFLRTNASGPALVHLVDWGLPTNTPSTTTNYFRSPSGEQIRQYDRKEITGRSPPAAFTLVLPRSLPGLSSANTFQLILPAPYNEETHRQARESGNYASLVISTNLSPVVTNNEVRLAIPALQPYGVVKISTSSP